MAGLPLQPAICSALRQGVVARTVLVRALSGMRGPAPVAQQLYAETAESIAAREQAAEQRRLARSASGCPRLKCGILKAPFVRWCPGFPGFPGFGGPGGAPGPRAQGGSWRGWERDLRLVVELDKAEQGGAITVAIIDRRPVQIVVMPVRAPVTVTEEVYLYSSPPLTAPERSELLPPRDRDCQNAAPGSRLPSGRRRAVR